MNVPALRFKNDDGNEFPDWEKTLLGEIGKFKSGTGFPDSEQGGTSGTPFFKVSDMNLSENYSEMLVANNYVSEEQIKKLKYKVITDEAIVFAKVGAAIFLERKRKAKNFLIDNNMMAYIPACQIDFAMHFMNSIKLSKFAQVGALPSYNASDLSIIKIAVPSKEEQNKIANFLTAVDEKIIQLTQKHELLNKYKKGVMQKIFNQKLRFKDDDGNDFPDWKRTTLGDLCSITTGKLDANAMVENGAYRFYTCAKEYYKIDNYAFDTDALLISGNGANVGYIHHYKGKFNAYQRTYVLDGFGENIIFVKYLLDAFLHIRIFKEAKEGNTPYIVMGTLTEMPIQLPSIDEQTKVANFLTSIDEKIYAAQAQLEILKLYKKGLLQRMFAH